MEYNTNNETKICRLAHLHIETSMNFYKMALARNLTRGRKQQLNHAACVYMTCRTNGTPRKFFFLLAMKEIII